MFSSRCGNWRDGRTVMTYNKSFTSASTRWRCCTEMNTCMYCSEKYCKTSLEHVSIAGLFKKKKEDVSRNNYVVYPVKITKHLTNQFFLRSIGCFLLHNNTDKIATTKRLQYMLFLFCLLSCFVFFKLFWSY